MSNDYGTCRRCGGEILTGQLVTQVYLITEIYGNGSPVASSNYWRWAHLQCPSDEAPQS